MNSLKHFLFGIFKDSLTLYWGLLKIMVPVMIVVRAGIGFGLHEDLAVLMAPVMAVVGLPPETGLVFVTNVLVGLYGGAAVLVPLLSQIDMTVADATILASMMLVSHALPMEQQIVKKAGLGLLLPTLFRLAMALLYGWILHLTYQSLDLLQEPLNITWLPEAPIDSPWGIWFQDAALTLFYMFWVVLMLILVLKLFDITGATRLITTALSPFMSIMGISKAATTLTMTGVMLGLLFGGSLIVREAQTGKLGHRTIFLSLAFMSLCHSLIEDTLFALVIGGHVSGVLFGRLAFAVIIMMIVNKALRALPDTLFYRYFFTPPNE